MFVCIRMSVYECVCIHVSKDINFAVVVDNVLITKV